MSFRRSQTARAAVLGAILCASVAATQAADYFVRTDGSDTAGGTTNSASGAFATVKKCLQTAQPGDRCLVQPGTYTHQRGATFPRGGSLESNNLLSNCTCTKGATTISCISNIPATVNAGDYVQCDSGYGFSWSRVASVAGSTITLAEPYRGATSTSANTDTLDVARFIVVSGQGATSRDVVFTDWYDAPASVTWVRHATYPDVWYYDPAAVTGTDAAAKAWRGKWCSNAELTACTTNSDCPSGGTCRLMLKGIRDWNYENWDTYRLPINNGIEGYDRLGSTSVDPSYGTEQGHRHNCPAGDGMGHDYNVSTVPGSYTYDVSGTSPKVYVYPRRRCEGGTTPGRHCLQNSDCWGTGAVCGAAKSPATYRMQASYSAPLGDAGQWTQNITLDGRADYVIVENLTIDAGYHGGGSGGAPMAEAVLLGGSNSRFSNLNVWSGQIRWYMSGTGTSAGSTDALFDSIKAWGGNYCSPAANDSPVSGMKFYNIDMRGTTNQVFNCDSMRGASREDRIVFDRMYFHRNYSGKVADGNGDGNTCSGNAITWDPANDRFKGATDPWDPGHGPYWGHPEGGGYVTCNVLVRNSIVELTSDGIAAFTRSSPSDPNCKDVIFANNTFALENVPNESLHARFGVDTGGSGTGILYNNVLMSEWDRTSMSIVWRGSTTDPQTITSDYNLFNYYALDANPGSTAVGTSPRIWGYAGASENLPQVINSYGEESHSIMVCKDSCQGITPGTHYNSASPRFVDVTTDDGTPTNFTPTSDNWGVNKGAPNSVYPCPAEDFYGNPRNDGACDIGAVEYQGVDTTPPSPVTNVGSTPGDARVTINFNHSASSDTRGALIRFKTTGYPTSSSDGTVACDLAASAPGAAGQCVHTGLTNGTVYYYGIYAYDAKPNFAAPVQTTGSPAGTANAPPAGVQNNRRTDVR